MISFVNISILSYTFLHANSTISTGGVGLYILNSISYNLLGKNQLVVSAVRISGFL